MDAKEMETRIEVLEKQVQTLQDLEEIRTLQRAYGYYLEHWMADEITDLFSDGPDVSLTLAAGTYLGKDGVKKYFTTTKPNNEFLHQVMQLAGIVKVDPDGKTAKGRWSGFGAVAVPHENGVREIFMGGIYGGEYVKEDGVWKFKKLRFDMNYTATPATGWVKPDRLVVPDPSFVPTRLEADIPRTFNPGYPSGYIFPFFYKHPVTGKKSSEEKINAAIEGVNEWQSG
ncbi:MAG: nuclear transport factor 2 family protein [Desulfobacterales bacterium]|jgi:hypothetical protein